MSGLLSLDLQQKRPRLEWFFVQTRVRRCWGRKTTAERRATMFSDHFHAKARRSVVDLAKDPGCDRAWAKETSLMVNDCRNRFWLLARAVEDNCSTLRPIVVRQSLS